MGVPIPEMEPVENGSAEALLDSLKTIDPAERRKHASVFNYWLSIRGPRQFPPIRDLDPLEISDAGPWSILLEMIGGGEDAVVRHFGQEIRDGEVEKIGEAPGGSLLACIHSKLPIVAACREAYAFEQSFDSPGGKTRCWVTLLPFSANDTWIDFVYGYVSLDAGETAAVAPAEAEEPVAIEEPVEEPPVDEAEPEVAEETIANVEPEAALDEEPVAEEVEPFKVPLAPLDDDPGQAEALPEPEPEPESKPEPVEQVSETDFEEQPDPVAEYEPEPEPAAEYEPEPTPDPELEAAQDQKPGFAKFLGSLANVGGFYGKVAQSGPELPAEAFVEETIEAAPEEQFAAPTPVPTHEVEASLESKLTNVRALADEAREAQIRSNQALYEGLSAAYDFALDAEGEPEQYLRLVEAQGLKIQLRSPMKPVVRLAFDGMCDEPTIGKLEAVLAWALKQDLPRGSLRERIEAEGGIGQILHGKEG